MKKLYLTSFLLLLMFGCEKTTENKTHTANINAKQQKILPVETPLTDEVKPVKAETERLPPSAFMSAEWIDLIPKDDLNALLNPPSYIADIAENSAEDQLNGGYSNTAESNIEDRYQQALVSTRVIEASNNLAIRIPAFIVPLEFDDQQRVTQFFMVPFFGACIHEPPPPPNQTIFVNYPQGFILESLMDPYWISGILKTSLVKNEMATAAYTMEVHAFELYTYE